ncbi:preprotein translocase subunit SecE [bacterium]|nr:preprotein translocase subunit SecE [bacterium]
MNAFTQYLKDTRAELNHVAWPTQMQTIIYTILVAAISLGISFYLGFFDFLFTSGLSNVVKNLPAASIKPPITIEQQGTTTTPSVTATTTPESPQFNL